MFAANRTLLIVCTYYVRTVIYKKIEKDLEKKNHEILSALQYKPLYNISRSEKWDKKIQAAAYNGARTVFDLFFQLRLPEENNTKHW